MRQLNNHVYIVSAYKTNLDKKENESRHEELKVMLSSLGIDFVELQGYYKGSLEASLLVNASEKSLKAVQMAVRDYDQESYLESYQDRFTELVFADGNRQGIGTLRAHGPNMPDLDSWSYSPFTGLYYVTE